MGDERYAKARGTTVSFAVFALLFSKQDLTVVALRSLANKGRDGKRVGEV